MALADIQASAEVGMLRDWCRWMGFNVRKALLILGIPEDCDHDQMQECLEGSLWVMGRFEVVGRVFREEDDAYAALVELEQEVNYAVVPREIPGIGRPWSVVFVPRCSGEDFLGRLLHFLEQQGQTVESVAGALGLGLSKVCWLRSFSRAIQPWVETVRYQPLGVFSGRDPPAPGEESFDTWVDRASEMLLVWEGVSEREKRRRLIEGLRGPALHVAYNILSVHRNPTVQHCLDALSHVFGEHDSQASLRFKCVTAEPEPGESLSGFVLRLEMLLQKALQQKALDPASVDHLRLRQLIPAIPPAFKKLRATLGKLGSVGQFPSFEHLLSIVQDAERWHTTPVRRPRDQGAAAHAVDASAQADARAKAQAEGDKVEEKQQEQENSDNHAQAPAGLSQAGLAEAPGNPLPADMGRASWAVPRDPNSLLGRLMQALDKEAEEHYQEGLKPIQEEEESESEDGAGELSPSMSSPGK